MANEMIATVLQVVMKSNRNSILYMTYNSSIGEPDSLSVAWKQMNEILLLSKNLGEK